MKNSFFKKIYNTFFLTSVEKELHNYFSLKKRKRKTDNIILVQCVEDYIYYGLFGKVIGSMKQNVVVEQCVVRNLTLGATSSFSSFLKSILLNNRFRDNKWTKLYSSYCDNVAYRHEDSNILFDIKAIFKAYQIYKNLHNKDELISLVIDEIKVGDLNE